MHGGLPQDERIKNFSDFKSVFRRIMVATELCGRGVDFASLNLVINFDMPKLKEDYMHRVGRAGRFETKGQAISFVTTEEDKKVLKEI